MATVPPSPRRRPRVKASATPSVESREPDRLLTVRQAAERFGTTERYPRRLIAERRITFVKLGRHVRIPEHAIEELIAAGTVKAVQ